MNAMSGFTKPPSDRRRCKRQGLSRAVWLLLACGLIAGYGSEPSAAENVSAEVPSASPGPLFVGVGFAQRCVISRDGSEFITIGSRASYVSPDGIEWQPWSRRVPSNIDYGNGRFVGCSTGMFSYSKDGRTWISAELPTGTQISKLIFVPGP